MVKTTNYHQYRRSIGYHLNACDKKQGTQLQQQKQILHLANRPGRHTGNFHQQDVAHAIVCFIAICNRISNDNFPFTKLNRTTNADKGRHPIEPLFSSSSMAMEDNITLSTRFIDKLDYLTAYLNIQIFPGALAQPLKQNDKQQGIHLIQNKNPIHLAASAEKKNTLVPLFNESSSMQEVIYLTKFEQSQKIFIEQNKILDELRKSPLSEHDKNNPIRRVNKLIHYVLSDDSDKRLQKIARILLIPSGNYGSNEEEIISTKNQLAVFIDFIDHAIFGRAFDKYCIKEIMKNNSMRYHQNMQNKIYNLMHPLHGTSLTNKAHLFYQDNVLQKRLPTLLLQLTPEENKLLKSMDITQAEWGFIHAGTLLLQANDVDLSGIALDELREVGVTLFILLSEEALPPEYAGYFRMPALFHHAKTTKEKIHFSNIHDNHIKRIYLSYFTYLQDFLQENDPFVQLNKLQKNWKTRTHLAKEFLTKNNLPEYLLASYLNHHSEFKINKNRQNIILPNIDTVFNEQNKKFADTFYQVNRILLVSVFDSFSQEENNFIINARVNRLHAQFCRYDTDYDDDPFEVFIDSLTDKKIPDDIILFQAIKNNEERIYVLNARKATGEYVINRIDRNSHLIYALLGDNTPYQEREYLLDITVKQTLKEKTDSLEILIDNIAEIQKKLFNDMLFYKGYEKTVYDNIKSFLLHLVPLYTCITDLIEKNYSSATLACSLDAITLIPVIGLATSISGRFGIALGRATVLSLKYAATRVTINSLLKETGIHFIKQFPSIAEKVSPEILYRLGIASLHSIDPGIQLLKWGGVKGINALTHFSKKLSSKNIAWERLHNMLAKKDSRLLPPLVQPGIEHLYSPIDKRFLNVVPIGKNRYVQIDSDTGMLFGRKFTRNAADLLEAIPVSFGKRIYLLRTEGLGGKGSKVAASKLQKETDNLKRYPIIGTGSMSTVYDIGDGFVIKKYTGIYSKEYPSRFDNAKNNVEGFKRYYGDSSASIILTGEEGAQTVLMKMRKVHGFSLSSVRFSKDKDLLIHLEKAIKTENPIDELSRKLQLKGINHNDINTGNVMYDRERGFSIVDFDSATFYPEGTLVSDPLTKEMRNRLSYVFNEASVDIKNALKNIK